ncbi:MAG: hypothetical protein ACOYMG_18035 [Candidatus Methylumidiphilus sp.]
MPKSSVQGRQTLLYVVSLIKQLRNRLVTLHGTGFWHPCQNDGNGELPKTPNLMLNISQ